MNLFISIMFLVVGFGLILAAIWYTPSRFSRLWGLRRAWPLCISVAVVVVAAIVAMISLSASSNAIFGIMSTAAGLLFGLFVYCTLIMVGLDIIKHWLPLSNRNIAGTVLGLAVMFTFIGAWQANDFKVTKVEIPIAGLIMDVTIMHIPDMHIGHHRGRAYLEQIVGETNRHRPDLVLINGDLVDSNIALEPRVLSALAQIEAPTYFTTGNHEHYVDTKRALDIIARHGVRILHNELVETHGLQLVGLDYMNADENTFDMHAVNKMTIKAELPKIPLSADLPVILMHHSPVGLDYVVEAGIALMLSGHTHAGQMFPATLLNRFIFPLNKGLHKRGSTTFFVSPGAGTYGPRIRLGSRNEITLITLKANR